MSRRYTIVNHPVARLVIFPTIKFFVKKTVGLEHLPKKGPYIIACKHVGPLDGIFIGAVIISYIKRKIHFVANVARWGWFWEEVISKRWAGCIPYYREHPQLCLDTAQEYLRGGKVIGIFPEGIIQEYKPNKHRAKTGAARLAIWARVPIVPIGLQYDITVRSDLPRLERRRQVIKNTLLNPHSLEIHIGQPFELNDYYDVELSHQELTNATHDIMKRVDQLTKIRLANGEDSSR